MSTDAGRRARSVSRPDLRLSLLLVLATACSEGAAEIPGACGDGTLDPGESCDDGNVQGGDGCSPTCGVEARPVPPGAACGNGLREDGEACDDGNTNPGDGCTAACSVRLGWLCPEVGSCRVHCGDGIALEGEACDDGNSSSGDGCSEVCATEPGWSCEQTSSGGACTSICGDGLIVGDETCDDGNQLAGDGCSPSCVARDVWLPFGDLAGSPRLTGATAVWSGSEMIVWGGRTSFGTLATGFRFEPRAGRVVATSMVGAPVERENHVAVWSGTEMLVFGGYSDRSYERGDGGRYDPLRDRWRPMSALDAPTPRILSSGVWTGSELIVWGGYVRGSPGPDHRGDGGRYDPALDVWRSMNEAGAPSPRAAPVVVSTGDAVLVWGGVELSYLDSYVVVSRHPVDGARYDPSQDVWRPISTRGAAPARQETGIWTGHELILVPCLEEGTVLGGVRYDPVTDFWSPLADFPGEIARCSETRASWTGSELVVAFNDATAIYVPALDSWTLGPSSNDLARSDARQVWAEDELLVWGGLSSLEYHLLRDGLRWRLDSAEWRPLGATIGLEQRASGTLLWTGSEAMIFGAGRYRFNPLTSGWRRMSSANAPVGWFNPSAVWTGSELIVWGGLGGWQEDGGIYTPATDTWRALAPRSVGTEGLLHSHAAVWTGSEMLIWGGAREGAGFPTTEPDEGWRFDPVLERWSEMSRVGSPGPRRGAVAVWTGQEMIVLAGSANHSPARGAASYDPVLDRWSPLPSPPGRTSFPSVHGGVWTGSRLFVLGYQWTAFYDPRTQEWELLPSDNQPVVSSASCVWTGTDVIVWGGSMGGGVTANGVRYDVALGRWISLPTEGAPSARLGHDAIWTGSEMIVWGGIDGGLGGRFLR